MPKPIEEQFIIPVAAARAAAEAYMAQDPSKESFADFFDRHELQVPAGYETFCSAARTAEERGLVLPGDTTADCLEYLCVEKNLDALLDAAALDVQVVYVAGRQLLAGLGVKDPEIVPIIQRSKRLAHHIGSIPSAQGLMCLADTHIGPTLRAHTYGAGELRKLDVTAEAYRKHVMPNISRDNGCPMLSELADVPASNTTSEAATNRRVKIYDLYWDALVAQAHRGVMMYMAHGDAIG